MKRQWHLRRQFRISEDDDRQRDQAYQHLTSCSGRPRANGTPGLPLSCVSPQRRKSMRTAISGRVSTERQIQAQTIEQQRERLQAHLAARGEELAAEDIFRDEGYRGASLNWPGLDQLRDKV